MSKPVDKDSLQLDKPRRTPGHPTKSHIVKTKVDGKERIIRFGEQGASTAGKPKAGESERMTKKRASFKARHAKNIAKGKSSPAYWADKVKWADGGSVELRNMLDQYEGSDDLLALINHMQPQRFDRGGQVSKDEDPGLMDYLQSIRNTVTSLPDVPRAVYNAGKRAVKAVPSTVRSGIDYVQRSTPQQVARDVRGGLNQVRGGFNRVVQHVKENPVSTVVDMIPIVGDIKAYGEDVDRAARLRAQGNERAAQDIEQFALPMAVASIVPGVGEARKVSKVVDVVDEASEAARPGTRTMKAPASFPVNYGAPKGNLNLRPNVDPATLKGAEVQDIDSLINQLRGRPGVTREGLEAVASQFEPGEKVSKAQFGERMPRSEYSTVDLASAVNDPFEHLLDDARHMVNQDRGELFIRMAQDAGLDSSSGRFIQDIHDNGYDPLDLDHVNVAEYLRSISPRESNLEDFIDYLYNEQYDDAVNSTVEQLQDMAGDGAYGDPGGYSYRDYQRLVAGDRLWGHEKDTGYFELGVTHPEMTDKYRHYPNAENLAGHIRGTFLGKNPQNLLSGLLPLRSYDPPVTVDEWLGGRGSRDFSFQPKSNSMVIEELQSDAAKNLGDSKALHQIHGTLFKGAIQHALEGGVNTVYLPTSRAVGIARYTDPKDYRSIYDKEVIKYGLNPLRDIPGVDIKPIEDMYYEINVSPEAREYILKGRGQKAPGYAEGGLVSSYDEAMVSELADKIREGIYG
jgi:hypothetical protein